MKIALFSDIHANLPALEAFFADVEKREVDALYCLGDLVGYNIWPNEVVEEIRKRKIPTLTGNYDFGIGKSSDDCGCAYKTDEEKANGAISIQLTNELITAQNRSYLRALPAHIKLEFQLNDDKLNLLLVHGSPRRVNEYLFEDRAEKSMIRILNDADADVLCFGHTHKPYHRIFEVTESGTPQFKHAINLGSIGKPKDSDNRGSYVILNFNENSSVLNKDSITVEFVKFTYDIEKAAKAVEDSVLPNSYAENLRNGY
ncbi:metallophosphoesterase family protein [Leeuwenhoekiella marinoflava]|uniref:Predicted phosphodiesterase n=2 Tax=Leeuwenhoekiella marinoflava TaxID=988 RepID=A0ABY1HRB7_9FLAO|nr:metallophosphoesterase family protein [Leeuwenhoekiella marinoflava]RXG32354.1 putative phosphodiesterase [Leeuwenhoekiella marinoflava]SHE78039.1 Predicted phosphodiesterase [Leeuwenhoekiella marinoflava DSM 3653]